MTRCNRTWEVEAARDGRLTEAERASLTQHVASCELCATEERALSALGTLLCERRFVAPDQLTLRRRRLDLLAHASGQQVDTVDTAQSWFGPWKGRAAFSALILGGALFWLGTRPDAEPKTGVRPPLLAVMPDQGARYTRALERGVEIIDLREGRLTLRIRRGQGDPKVIVRTPDGEIEDVGTTFAVEVSAGRTRSVEVFEGRVIVHAAGQEPRHVRAAEVYLPHGPAPAMEPNAVPEPAPALAPAAKEPAEEAAPKAADPKTSASHTGIRGARRALVVRASEQAIPEAAPEGADAQFLSAVRKLETGDLSAAAAALEGFVSQHPEDRHAEDAAYLRVVSLMRLGQTERARAAAHAYLARFPQGFRAPDIERVLQP